jgi:hypothetical protein
MFSPKVRLSLSNFLRFCLAVRAWPGRGREDIVPVVVSSVECMLNEEDTGERDVDSSVMGEIEGFILAVGSDRS